MHDPPSPKSFDDVNILFSFLKILMVGRNSGKVNHYSLPLKVYHVKTCSINQMGFFYDHGRLPTYPPISLSLSLSLLDAKRMCNILNQFIDFSTTFIQVIQAESPQQCRNIYCNLFLIKVAPYYLNITPHKHVLIYVL